MLPVMWEGLCIPTASHPGANFFTTSLINMSHLHINDMIAERIRVRLFIIMYIRNVRM